MKASPPLEQRRVYDPLLRIMHAANAASILTLLATGFGAEAFEEGAGEALLWDVHVGAGYALVVGLTARLAWGLVGPRSARFSDLWHPRAWRSALIRLRLEPSGRYGHDEFASLVFLVLYAALAVMAATGLALAAIEHGVGPLAPALSDAVWLAEVFEEPHEALAWLVGALVSLHLAAVVYHQFVEGVPTAQSMLSGVQYRPARDGGGRHG